MPRLIDADESLKRINDIYPGKTESDYQKGIAVGMAMAKIAIHEQQTIDAEPVVYCGKCKYYPYNDKNKETRPWCKLFVFKEPGYCSYGRKENR